MQHNAWRTSEHPPGEASAGRTGKETWTTSTTAHIPSGARCGWPAAVHPALRACAPPSQRAAYSCSDPQRPGAATRRTTDTRIEVVQSHRLPPPTPQRQRRRAAGGQREWTPTTISLRKRAAAATPSPHMRAAVPVAGNSHSSVHSRRRQRVACERHRTPTAPQQRRNARAGQSRRTAVLTRSLSVESPINAHFPKRRPSRRIRGALESVL
jgi:hypothetical protein